MDRVKYRQGQPFAGEYFWENDHGDEAPRGGKFEGHLENRYEARGSTTVYDGREYWHRHRVS
ncbi:hypothetical protein DET50_13016 [Marinobacter pelagius]|uniref:Uncharacterized protein n=2 Tax=Marinobacter TaxID=2742 RepID=A0A368UTH9_MARNT|nr:hypothetical protein DET50_13016 [Marinobacter pelagius]RBP68696.1 hypothetical protein DET64_11711 [Marinobacter nauticus]RCW30171.1 hypothetical protein DET51_11735 [Marinobacter nauticus]